MSSNNSRRVVLVVEDDALLRMVTAETVQDAGFDVVEAENADDAVAILAARSDIVLVMTDVDMPGSMDGIKLAHAIRGRWPPIKLIVVSGKARPTAADLPADARFFCKPYSVTEMTAALQSLMSH